MTNERAEYLLRRYGRECCDYNPRYFTMAWRDALLRRCVYRNFAVRELIRRIRQGDRSPLETVYALYSELDDVLAESDEDAFLTHQFAAEMENEVGDILRYLKRKDEEDEKNGLEERR